MKIIQVTPGNIPIPPNGWGAVEKVIWEYKTRLDNLGYPTQILYTDEVTHDRDQIVHVHMANLAHILHQRGIPYVFSLHDHHVEYFGRDSHVWRENYEAIKNSQLTFVHSHHLIDFFDRLDNIVYLGHGVNLEDYLFRDRSSEVAEGGVKLLMMANNGVGGDPLSDRKGFLPAIEAARILGYEIHILCPGSNKVFFEHWKPEYEGLHIFYDLDYKESLKKMDEYQIFLHPSNLEAGHPNLTLLESLSLGIPVVGTCNIDLPGLTRCQRDPVSISEAIKRTIKGYNSLVCSIKNHRLEMSWDLVVSRMLQFYKKFLHINQKNQLLHNYTHVPIKAAQKTQNTGVRLEFSWERAFCKVSFSGDYLIVFSDRRTGKIKYHGLTQKSTNIWFAAYSQNEFVDWYVEVKEGTRVIHSQGLELAGNSVLLILEDLVLDHGIIKNFMEDTKCNLTIKSKKEPLLPGIGWDPEADPQNFYYSLNYTQLVDYFKTKPKMGNATLVLVNSDALGDRISSVSYAEEWARIKNQKTDLMISSSDLFSPSDYPHLNILERSSIDYDRWNNIIYLDYKFDVPVQRGFSDQLGLEFKELRPIIKKSGKDNQFKSPYVCFGVHSTCQGKYWNYPDGWETLAKKFREIGITPVSVDKFEVFGVEGWWNSLPKSSVKKTGLPFSEVINIIEHSLFFVGVSSGLSWLAHGLGKKVVLISGITFPDNEFTQDVVRISNPNVCNSCFTKVNNWKFDPSNWAFCPEKSGTRDWFECSRTITPQMVWERIVEEKLI